MITFPQGARSDKKPYGEDPTASPKDYAVFLSVVAAFNDLCK